MKKGTEMLGQIDIFGKTKLEATLERIKTFEPEDGYFVAFSGGKDSQCILELCKMAGVKYDAHYSVTSVDPPELVRFIKRQYPEVAFDHSIDKDGRWNTMWSLIANNTMPPTRIVRYCCEKLKESNGQGRVTMTGVRWAESTNRKNNQGAVTIIDGKRKKTQKLLEGIGANFTPTDKGGWYSTMTTMNSGERSSFVIEQGKHLLIRSLIGTRAMCGSF